MNNFEKDLYTKIKDSDKEVNKYRKYVDTYAEEIKKLYNIDKSYSAKMKDTAYTDKTLNSNVYTIEQYRISLTKSSVKIEELLKEVRQDKDVSANLSLIADTLFDMLEKLEYAAILYRKVAKATTLFYHPKYKLEDMYLLENKIFSYIH